MTFRFNAPAIAPEGGCERLACCIPFCRRTFKNDKAGTPWAPGSIVMCGAHWRTGPADLRKRHRGLRRLQRKVARLMNAAKRERLLEIVDRWENESWHRIKDAIAEHAAGIA